MLTKSINLIRIREVREEKRSFCFFLPISSRHLADSRFVDNYHEGIQPLATKQACPCPKCNSYARTLQRIKESTDDSPLYPPCLHLLHSPHPPPCPPSEKQKTELQQTRIPEIQPLKKWERKNTENPYSSNG